MGNEFEGSHLTQREQLFCILTHFIGADEMNHQIAIAMIMQK